MYHPSFVRFENIGLIRSSLVYGEDRIKMMNWRLWAKRSTFVTFSMKNCLNQTHRWTHTHAEIRAHTHTHTHTHIYIYIYIYIYSILSFYYIYIYIYIIKRQNRIKKICRITYSTLLQQRRHNHHPKTKSIMGNPKVI